MMSAHPVRLVVRRVGIAGVLAMLAACAESLKVVAPQQFESPDAAAAALVAASETFDVAKLTQILGGEGAELVQSKDPVQDRNTAAAFAAEARVHQRIELDSAKSTAVLTVGASDWPLGIPIVRRGDKWSFDGAAGKEEILRRRIGRNELDAIEVCRGFVEAQHAYALERHDGMRVNQYAQRVVSTKGKQDGLAWQDPDGTWRGPVGEAIARFIAEGYSDRQEPFHGYYFKVLKGQGPSAKLGQIDFVVDGAMIGGFAMVAAPAEYLVTGVKTFIVSHEGVVYEKDLGDQTLERFRKMERYDPDSTWTPVPGT